MSEPIVPKRHADGLQDETVHLDAGRAGSDPLPTTPADTTPEADGPRLQADPSALKSPGFTVILRGLKQPITSGLTVTRPTAAEATRAALETRDYKVAQPVLQWKDKARLCVADVDYHALPFAQRPSEHQLTCRAAGIHPRPFCFHTSHGRGCKLYFEAADGYTAEELAAVAALSWLTGDRRASVDLITSSRHPAYARPNYPDCGPPHYQTPGTDMSALRFLYAGRRVDPDSDVAIEARDRVLDERGLDIGRRYSPDHCPFDPQCRGKNDPVYVTEEGIGCYRCKEEGACFPGCRTSGWAYYTQLDPEASAAVAVTSPLRAMAQRGARFAVVKKQLQEALPGVPEKLLRPLWSACVFTAAQENGDDIATARRKADDTAKPVNRITNYTEEPRQAAKPGAKVNGPDTIELSDENEAGTTATVEGLRGGKVVFSDRPNLSKENQRKKVAVRLGISAHQLFHIWRQYRTGKGFTFKVSELPEDPPGSDEFAAVDIVGRNVNDIAADLVVATGEKLNDTPAGLFAVEDGKVVPLNDANELKAHAARAVASAHHPIDWRDGANMPTWTDTYPAVRRAVPHWRGAFPVAHYPRVEGMFCLDPVPEPADKRDPTYRGTLDRFIDHFNPATPIDRVLLKAAYVTPYWGGPPGQRPIIMPAAPENDPQGGRGIGKTTVARVFSSHVGGMIDFTQDDTVRGLKTRIFSSEGACRWVVCWDNVKSDRLSNGDFEALVTASEHSGHKLFVGEARVPNYHTYFITLNGVSLSKDFAQRVVPIRLARPTDRSPTWEADVAEFFTRPELRQELGAEAIDVIRRAENLNRSDPMTGRWGAWKTADGLLSRWAVWEKAVLAGCCEDEAEFRAVLAELADRRADGDADDVDGQTLAEAIRRRIKADHVIDDADLVEAVVELTPETVAFVANDAFGRRNTPKKPAATLAEVSRYAGSLPQLVRVRTNSRRVYFWVGDDVPEAARLRSEKDHAALSAVAGAWKKRPKAAVVRAGK